MNPEAARGSIQRLGPIEAELKRLEASIARTMAGLEAVVGD